KRDVIRPIGFRADGSGPPLERFFRYLLARSPEERFPNIEALCRELDSLRDTFEQKGKPKQPSSPLLGDDSIAKYQWEQSLLSLPFTGRYQPVEEPEPEGTSPGIRPSDSSAREIGSLNTAFWGRLQDMADRLEKLWLEHGKPIDLNELLPLPGNP